MHGGHGPAPIGAVDLIDAAQAGSDRHMDALCAARTRTADDRSGANVGYMVKA